MSWSAVVKSYNVIHYFGSYFSHDTQVGLRGKNPYRMIAYLRFFPNGSTLPANYTRTYGSGRSSYTSAYVHLSKSAMPQIMKTLRKSKGTLRFYWTNPDRVRLSNSLQSIGR